MKKILTTLFIGIANFTLAQSTATIQIRSNSGNFSTQQAKLITLLPSTPVASAAELDVNKYGSSNQISEIATGYFYTKKIGNRWWFIDPEGKGHINIAMNSLYTFEDDTEAATGYDRLRELGFNGAGNFVSDDEQTSRYNNTRSNKFSYTLRINFFLTYKNVRKNYYTTPSAIQGDLGHVFVLDPKFAEFCDSHARNLEKYKNEKELLGYFIDNEINFNQDQLYNFLKNLSPGDPSYDAALAFATANELTKEQVLANQAPDSVLKAFATKLAEYYYQVTSAALKKYDPNHLNLGSRLHGRPRAIEGVVKAAAYYCDVVSVNFYDHYWPDNQITRSDTYQKWIDKPLIVGEFYVKCEDAFNAGWVSSLNSGAGWVVKTQNERGIWYQNCVIELLKSGRFVGWHWFKYKDDTDSNKGIIKNDANGKVEYLDLTSQMSFANNNRFKLINYFDGPTSAATFAENKITIKQSDKSVIVDGLVGVSTFRIYDNLGRLITTSNCFESYYSIPLNEIQKGLYIFKIMLNSGCNESVFKIII